MATLNATFDANQVEPQEEIGPLPAGKYPAMITDSEVKPTKAGDGQYLELVFTVIDGPCKGRKIWDRLNLWNRNQTAVDIAQRQLSAICHAVGVLQVSDSEQLHNRPLEIKVEYVPPKGEYTAKNEIKGYKPLATAGGSGAPAQTPRPAQPPREPAQPAPAQVAPPAPAPATGIPPWKQPKNQSGSGNW